MTERDEYKGILEPYFFIIERSADGNSFKIIETSEGVIDIMMKWRKMPAHLHKDRFIARSLFGGIVTAALRDLGALPASVLEHKERENVP
jgi:hypothetical protein